MLDLTKFKGVLIGLIRALFLCVGGNLYPLSTRLLHKKQPPFINYRL